MKHQIMKMNHQKNVEVQQPQQQNVEEKPKTQEPLNTETTTPLTTNSEKEVTEEPTQRDVKETDNPFAHESQKPIKDLTVNDIFMWKNLYVSGGIFIIGILYYTFLTKYQYSFVTLIGRILMLQVLLFAVISLFKFKTKESRKFMEIKITEEMLRPYLLAFIERFNNTTKIYSDILFLVDWKKTLKFLFLLQFLCFLGNRVTGVTLFFWAFLYHFTVPVIYNYKKHEFDAIFSFLKKKSYSTLS